MADNAREETEAKSQAEAGKKGSPGSRVLMTVVSVVVAVVVAVVVRLVVSGIVSSMHH